MSEVLGKLQRHWEEVRGRKGIDLNRYRKKKRDEFREIVREYIPSRGVIKNMVIVNVGGGPVPLKFYGKKEVLVDPLLSVLRDKFPKKYLKGIKALNEPIEETSVEDNYAHLVYCKQTLEYIAEWKKAISEIYRILKKNGYLVLIYHKSQGDNTNLNLLRVIDMEEYLKSVGFDILKFKMEPSSYTKILARKT